MPWDSPVLRPFSSYWNETSVHPGRRCHWWKVHNRCVDVSPRSFLRQHAAKSLSLCTHSDTGTTTECRCSRILILSNANIKFLFILTRPHRLQGSGNSGWRNTTLSARLRDMENSQSGPAWDRAVPTGTISGLPREVTPRVTKVLSSPSGGRVELPM